MIETPVIANPKNAVFWSKIIKGTYLALQGRATSCKSQQIGPQKAVKFCGFVSEEVTGSLP
jgi:hypothetical protein